MKDSVNVIFFGYEVSTAFHLANDDKFCLKAVAHNKSFTKYRNFNPVDQLFSTAYRLHYEGRNRMLVLLCLRLFQLLSFFASPYFKMYRSYLVLLVDKKIKVVAAKKADNLESFVKEHGVSLFVINYWSILPREIIRLPSLGCVNIHPSRLPQYKGALPTLWALKNKDKSSAVTYMLIDETVDGGKIFAQHEFDISPSDTAVSLEEKIKNITDNTFIRDLKDYLENRLQLREQHGKASITGRYEPYRFVDFKQECARDVLNKILYYHYVDPMQNCYTFHGGSRICFKGCSQRDDSVQLAPGYYSVQGLRLYIGCKDKALCFEAGKDIAFKHFFTLYAKQLSDTGAFQSSRIWPVRLNHK